MCPRLPFSTFPSLLSAAVWPPTHRAMHQKNASAVRKQRMEHENGFRERAPSFPFFFLGGEEGWREMQFVLEQCWIVDPRFFSTTGVKNKKQCSISLSLARSLSPSLSPPLGSDADAAALHTGRLYCRGIALSHFVFLGERARRWVLYTRGSNRLKIMSSYNSVFFSLCSCMHRMFVFLLQP